ncbi:hypothetical protein B0H16DRAFT_1476368 [Mycena metata]|uniref:Uncharacterized protein n=1 Tax=Mycena metata TaxID=1033252 RepID=A0AAD7HBZ5_9AGAR|nr:hypothetical protein B0H16DRAFT_1476368 [Mycena metata]
MSSPVDPPSQRRSSSGQSVHSVAEKENVAPNAVLTGRKFVVVFICMLVLSALLLLLLANPLKVMLGISRRVGPDNSWNRPPTYRLRLQLFLPTRMGLYRLCSGIVFLDKPPLWRPLYRWGPLPSESIPPLGADLTKRSRRDILQEVRHLDFLRATLVASAVTTLVLALQWGGNTKPWNDKAVIILPCYEYARQEGREHKALTRFSMLIFSYYIPIFYQAVRARSATQSGIDLLPFMLGTVLTVIIPGQIVGRTGYYWPFLVGSPVFLALGSGLLYTLNSTTSSAKLIGVQILAGIGIGMGMQNGLLAIQVEFRANPKLLAQATSMASFAQFLGGTLGLGVAEPVFASELAKNLLKFAPNAPAAIVKESPAAIWTALPAALRPGVVRSYAEIVFIVGVPVAGLGLIAAGMIKNIRIVKTERGVAHDHANTDEKSVTV